MRKTPIKVKNRKTGETKIVKVPSAIAEQWTKEGGLPGLVGSFSNALRYLEKQINSKNGSIDANGFIILKIG